MIYFVGTVSADFKEFCAKQNITYGRFTPNASKADGITTYFVDMTSQQAALNSLQKLPELRVDGLLVSGYEHFVLPAAWLAEYFTVPFTSVASAERATDKILMRTAFAKADPSITPTFTQVNEWHDIVQFMDEHAFPVMLKPANLMKSLFITKNDTIEELKANYEHMLAALPAVYRRYRLAEPRIIIEECMIGSMHTVAGFVDTKGTLHLVDDVVDCIPAVEIGKYDSYLFARSLPTHLPAQKIDEMRLVTQKGVGALGLSSTPIHAEIMLTAKGPRLIEIGARLGGYQSRMYALAKGLDLNRAAIDIALQRPLSLQATIDRTCTVLELFADITGIFENIAHEAELIALPSYHYYKLSIQPGDITGKAAEGYRAVATVILVHDDSSQIAKDIAWIRSNAVVRLRH